MFYLRLSIFIRTFARAFVTLLHNGHVCILNHLIKTIMRNLFVSTLTALALFTACSDNGDDGPVRPDPERDFPTNALVDASFVPGDQFYNYCNNSWVKSHPLAANQKSLSYWNDTEYNSDRFRMDITKSNDPVIARLMGDVERLDKTPSAELVAKIKRQMAEIDAINDIDDLVMKATNLGRKGYPVGMKFYLMPYKKNIVMQLLVELPEPAQAEAWTAMTGCSADEAKAFTAKCKSITDDWKSHMTLDYHTFPYLDDECHARALMAKEMGIAQADFVYDTTDYTSFLDYVSTASQADNWKMMMKQAVVAYNYSLATATKESLAGMMFDVASPFTYRLCRLYVDLYGHAVMRDFTYQMIEEIREGYVQMLTQNKWLSESTRQEALTKVHAIKAYCGYPDHWDESRMGTMPNGNNLLEDWTQLCEELADMRLKYITHSTTDDDVWYAIAQGSLPWYETNAMYLPECNKVFVFLPMMMPPICSKDAEAASNYGMLGTIVGHEFGHGFDNAGCLYDENGELRNWFAPQDKAELDRRMNCLADLNSKYVPYPEKYPDLHSNGKQTMGEDVADLNGINVAYLAMCNHYKKQGISDKDLRRMGQLFFLAYGNNWAGSYSEEYIINRIKTNVHSVAWLRVNGLVPHVDAWYDLYNVTPSNKLYIAPEQRVAIWNK